MPERVRDGSAMLGMWRFPVTETMPKSARDAVALLALSWGNEEIADTVKIAVSELVTNVLLHTAGIPGTTVTVEALRVGACFRVQVRDGSRAAPKLRRPDRDDEYGRGLLLVEAMTDACGWTPTPSGKIVWFDVKAPWPLDAAA